MVELPSSVIFSIFRVLSMASE